MKVLLAMCAMVLAAGSASAQGTVCDSPCKFILLPLVREKNGAPVPNTNPLPELQGKVRGQQLPFKVDSVRRELPVMNRRFYFRFFFQMIVTAGTF